MYTSEIFLVIFIVFSFVLISYCVCKGNCVRASPGIKTVRLPNGQIQAVYKRSSWNIQLKKSILRSLGLRKPSSQHPPEPEAPRAPRAPRVRIQYISEENHGIPCHFAKCNRYKRVAVPQSVVVGETVALIHAPPRPKTPKTEAQLAKGTNNKKHALESMIVDTQVSIQEASIPNTEALFPKCTNYKKHVPESMMVDTQVSIDEESSPNTEVLFAKCTGYKKPKPWPWEDEGFMSSLYQKFLFFYY